MYELDALNDARSAGSRDPACVTTVGHGGILGGVSFLSNTGEETEEGVGYFWSKNIPLKKACFNTHWQGWDWAISLATKSGLSI